MTTNEQPTSGPARARVVPDAEDALHDRADEARQTYADPEAWDGDEDDEWDAEWDDLEDDD